MAAIWRVGVGTLALTTYEISTLKVSAYIASKYSLRRFIHGPAKNKFSIFEFSTQQRPILHAVAQVRVWEAFAADAINQYTDPKQDSRVKAGIAAAFKACLTTGSQGSLYTLSERCGAQGLFVHNQIIEAQLETRGISIAEGDVLALCIRGYFLVKVVNRCSGSE